MPSRLLTPASHGHHQNGGGSGLTAGFALECLGTAAALLGGILVLALTTPTIGAALMVTGGLSWAAGWWHRHESWCSRCRSVVEKK